MRASGSFLLVAAGFLLGGAALLPQCSPEQLTYEPSGAGSPGDGAAGDSPIGVGGGTSWPEICGNGIDDDKNGKTDCEDPVCSNYACVALAPSGWNGPVALFQGDATKVPACPAGLVSVFDGNADPSYTAASCGSCSCGAPSADCTVSIDYYADTACSTLDTSYSASSNSGCGYTDGNVIGGVALGFTTSGSCGAGTPPSPTSTPPSWRLGARACSLAKGSSNPAGCPSGQVCAPLTNSSLACVYQSGDVACPAGYPHRHVWYQDFDDSRDCGSCGCSFSASGCSVDVSGFTDTSCGTQTFSASGSGCYPGDTHSVSVGGGSVSGATCQPGASTPSGCVAPAKPTTLCCAGTSGTECPSGKGPEMVEVPAPGGGTYCVDSTEVTGAQYQAFLTSNPSTANQPAECSWNTSFTPGFGSGSSNHPVTSVDWCDAYAFCAWAGKRLCGKFGGGPLDTSSAANASQSQWYAACSDGGTRKYPYGDTLVPGACPSSNGSADVASNPCCQGGYLGLYDLVGSVSEWEDGCQPGGGNPNPAHDQCLTGGQSSCDGVIQSDRNHRSSSIGFRCCAP